MRLIKIACWAIGILIGLSVLGNIVAPKTSEPTSTAPDKPTVAAASVSNKPDSVASGTSGNEATQTSVDPVDTMMTMLGGQHSATRSGDVMLVNLVVGGSQTIQNIPELQKLGFLNPDISFTRANNSGFAIPAMMCIQAGTVAIMSTYAGKNKVVDKLTVACRVSTPDDYGNIKDHDAISFNFSRELYNRINWDSFDYTKLPRVAPKFKITPWAAEQIQQFSMM